MARRPSLQIRPGQYGDVPGFKIRGRSFGFNVQIFVRHRDTAEAIRAAYYAAGWRDVGFLTEAGHAEVQRLILNERP